MYTEGGILKSAIEVKDGHYVLGVAFHYCLCKIIVLTFVRKESCCYLLSFSESGELQSTSLLFKYITIDYTSLDDCPQIVSHPNGPVLVIEKKSIYSIS